MRYGVMTDYDYSAEHKRQRLTIWSGSFAGTFEGEAFSLPKGDGFMVTTYNGDKVRVAVPEMTTHFGKRDEHTYQAVDAAISAALTEHHDNRGDVQMGAA